MSVRCVKDDLMGNVALQIRLMAVWILQRKGSPAMLPLLCLTMNSRSAERINGLESASRAQWLGDSRGSME